MQQYKIPQNVQIEDKIFGNILTLRQLIIIGIGGAISYILYTVLVRTYILGTIEIGLICIPGAIAVAFAFISINNISLFRYCLLFLEFIIKPQKRVWGKKGNIILTTQTYLSQKNETNTSKKGEKTPPSKEETLANLSSISHMLDTSKQFDHIQTEKTEKKDIPSHFPPQA